ncbi:deoxyribodipyrimidine photo-lyase [Nitrogeniibacter mangrovi]|uniref:Deoxyribodipyrimidine photo-lyase n=1 Tax=Nitrogeniibacter mangrovi TaxID=2016596 RepID=A0A6C1AZV9_9RHOO|nr:deoxyribodipyrimidine photo-lyase [Nitrogeniibacter mangrovi]QID16896.1 deoxyribodipyrimidine photo-lyase [Nitrogeniibacter mangrovi]
MAKRYSSGLVWFRRDLRAFDQAALHQALAQCARVHCAFVFDTDILDALPSRSDRRVGFIHASVVALDASLRALADRQRPVLHVRHGRAPETIVALAAELGVDAVFANRDYEPAAMARDAAVAGALESRGIAFHDFKDQVIFERDEILTGSGTPYAVFTPYKRAWRQALEPGHTAPFDVHAEDAQLPADAPALPTLAEIGFDAGNLGELKLAPGVQGGEAMFADFRERIEAYKVRRDYPALKGVSYLSVHLRFGTVSIRQLVNFALSVGGQGAETWLSELIWREFYQMVLWHRPDVVERCFKPEFDALQWDDNDAGFAAWCAGRTGYPLVDAGMRQLNQSGYMHNRLRMVVASFLTKDLGVDWRRGERYFAAQLNDYDLAANNGGWQWAASTGCDGQPWFRIFNPVTQSERFDPQGRFIRRYVPELARVPDKHIHAPWKLTPVEQAGLGVRIGTDYPAPIVDHALARERTLARFRAVRGQ